MILYRKDERRYKIHFEKAKRGLHISYLQSNYKFDLYVVSARNSHEDDTIFVQ